MPETPSLLLFGFVLYFLGSGLGGGIGDQPSPGETALRVNSKGNDLLDVI